MCPRTLRFFVLQKIISSSKRIPDFGVRPGLEVGTRVTIRDKKVLELLKISY